MPVNLAITNDLITKFIFTLDSHTDLVLTAAYQTVMAAIERANVTNNPLAPMLVSIKDLHTSSYYHRDAMKYT